VVVRNDALEARALIDAGVQLVDVLPRAMYDAEHLPGAISLPLETFDPEHASEVIDRERAVLVYCFDQH
jgi:rhodanese-related sulfurtransferase